MEIDSAHLETVLSRRRIISVDAPVDPHDDDLGLPDRLLVALDDGHSLDFGASVPTAEGRPTLHGARIDYWQVRGSGSEPIESADATDLLDGALIMRAEARVAGTEQGRDRFHALTFHLAEGDGVMIDAGDCLLTVDYARNGR